MKLVDLHADIGYDVLQKKKEGYCDILKKFHVPKWQAGGIDTVCMASFFDGHETWEDMQEMILALKEEIASCKEIVLVRKKEDFSSPCIKAVLSVEGMCGIKEQEEARIDWLHEQGIAMASLTWNDENYLATGVKGDPNRGISEAGIRAVRRMEKYHMIIDVSHANEKSFWDIMEHTRGMVVATHSNARELCHHVRNLWDEQLSAIAKRGGVIGAVAAPWFIHENEDYWDAAHMAKHTRYVQDRIGVEHASFGFDFMDFFTGYEEAYVKGLKDASQAQNIVHELRKISVSDTDLEKICYKNAIKILKTAFN